MSSRYDPEIPDALGSNSPIHSSPSCSSPASSRVARRWIIRRSRWCLGVLIGGSVIVYYSGLSASSSRRVAPWLFGNEKPPDGWQVDQTHGIWDEDKSPEPQNWGSNTDAEGGVVEGVDPDQPLEFIVNEYGDHYVQNYFESNRIPPFDPDLSKIPSPNTYFSEITIPGHLTPPKEKVFPPDAVVEIIPEDPPPPTLEHQDYRDMPDDAWVKNWTVPDIEWDGRGDKKLPKVQWEGFKKGKYENKAQRKERIDRREAVKRGFVHAWQAYKDHAWGHDETTPISIHPSNPFNNWGASIIDTVDTLLIMGLKDEYTLCRPHINQVNYHWLSGKDWYEGYKTPPLVNQRILRQGGNRAVEFQIPRDANTDFAVFETGIRYLGGLISGYDLSGDQLLLDRAIELAEMLGKAFNTEFGLPMGRMDPGWKSWFGLLTVSIAEVGSMTLEMTRLSQITGDRKWYDLTSRALDYIEKEVIPRTAYTPLIPLFITPSRKGEITGTVAWGGLADSYYEYLIKEYKLLGGSPAAEQYKRMYIAALTKAKEYLFIDVDTVPGRDLLAIGKIEGGMMGLGSKVLERPEDMEDAEKFAKTCYWLSQATPTGLQPESVEFDIDPENDIWAFENLTMKGENYHPYWERANLEKAVDLGTVHWDRNEVLRWNTDGHPVFPDDGGRKEEGPIEFYKRIKGVPIGTNRVVLRGINRPETIESIFYMYRLTGDRKWQDRGWRMFTAWADVAKVPGGMSSVYDVTKLDPFHSDNMESFTFAETFKYHYLLHSEPDLMSLDDYVFSTEAHPFLSNPDIRPGSQGFWKAPKSQNLGKRGRGTDAQLWTRLDVLKEHARRLMEPEMFENTGKGGGGGMGGGGGDPNYRPKPPLEFDKFLPKLEDPPFNEDEGDEPIS